MAESQRHCVFSGSRNTRDRRSRNCAGEIVCEASKIYTTMVKKLTRSGNSVALILDKPLLDQLGLDENAEVEFSTDGQVLIVTLRRGHARERRFREIVDEINKKYA